MGERNEELFRKIADAIEESPEQYEQELWECETMACIAGWALALSRGETIRLRQGIDYHDEAGRVLGLTGDDALDLFNPDWRPHDGLSVPDALRKIGEGAAIEDVSL